MGMTAAIIISTDHVTKSTSRSDVDVRVGKGMHQPCCHDLRVLGKGEVRVRMCATSTKYREAAPHPHFPTPGLGKSRSLRRQSRDKG